MGIIMGESIEALQNELNELESEKVEIETDGKETVKVTVAPIINVQVSDFERGLEKGEELGYFKGYEEGFDDGFDVGCEVGYADALEKYDIEEEEEEDCDEKP